MEMKFAIVEMGCQSGAVERSMFEINISACHLGGRGFDSIPSHVIERATLSDSVGFLRGLRFPPTLHYKSPKIVYRANNVLADANIFNIFNNGNRSKKFAIIRNPF
jgi:hypothetical protein